MVPKEDPAIDLFPNFRVEALKVRKIPGLNEGRRWTSKGRARRQTSATTIPTRYREQLGVHTSRTELTYVCQYRFGYFLDDTKLYLVMEYVEGGELFSHLRSCVRYDMRTICLTKGHHHKKFTFTLWERLHTRRIRRTIPSPMQWEDRLLNMTTDWMLNFSRFHHTPASTFCTNPQISRSPGKALHGRNCARLLLSTQPQRSLSRSQAGGTSPPHAERIRNQRFSECMLPHSNNLRN